MPALGLLFALTLFVALCAIVAEALRRFFLKLVAADNTQRAADQERHGETPCPPEVFSPFHDSGSTPDGQ